MPGRVVDFLYGKKKRQTESCPLFVNYKTYWIKYVLPSISTTPKSCAWSLIFPYDVLQHFYFFSFITISKSSPNASAICRISFSEKLSRFIFWLIFWWLVSSNLARSEIFIFLSTKQCLSTCENITTPSFLFCIITFCFSKSN